MSFADWSNEKKKKNKQEEEQAKNTQAVLGGKTSFSDWSNSKKADSVDETYINTFITDANGFLGSAEKDYKGMGWSNASSTYRTKRSTWNDLEVRASHISEWLNRNKSKIEEDTYKSLSEVLSSFNSNASSMLDGFKSASEFYSQFKTEDEYNEWNEYYKKKSAEEQEVMGADDYEEYSQKGAAIENPTMKGAEGWLTIGDWRLGGEGIGNIVTYSRDNDAELRLGAANNSNLLGDFRYSHMTDNEVGIYNYYLAKYGEDKANEYLASIDDELDQREAGRMAEAIDDNVFLEALLGFSAGVETSVEGIKSLGDFFTGNKSGTDYSATQYADQIIASNNTGVLKGVHDVSSAIGGMVPSILVSTITFNPALGAVTMGASAVGNAYNEMISLGYNEWQARGYGLLVGASEAALQYALGGISKLGGKVTGNAIIKFLSKFDNALARTAIQLGGNMASEGIEEAIQTILEPAFKAMMTGETFEAPEWEEVWYSALLGALTAGVMEGVPTIAKTATNSYQAKSVYGADAKALVGEALEIDPNNAHAQRMQARLDNGKNVSGYQLNRLVEANESALYSQDKAKIKSDTEARLTELGEKGDIGKLADILVKKASGEALSITEKATLKKSTYGQRVANELSPANIESGEYSSAWAEDIGTERINAQAYNKGDVIDAFDLAVKQTSVAQPHEEDSVTETPTSKENTTEAKFEASTDGKTKIGDLEVSIKEIASVKDGDVILRLDDDSTVNASDVEFGSSAEALLYENVADMNLNAATANAFIKGYDPSMSADQYAKGFREAYRYGEYGFPVQEMSTEGFSAMLLESQKSLAYNLGKTDAKYKVESKQEKIASTSTINAEKNVTKATKKGKVHYGEGISMKSMTQRQQASLKGLETLAEALGVDIHIFESPVVNGKRQGANGWYDPSDNSIHLDLHAGFNGEGTILFTAAHELTHFIRAWSPAKFKVFADFLLEQYGKKGVSVDALVREQIEKAKRNGRDISYDTAYEEVIADSCEAMLADGDVVAKIAELKAKDKTLWQKIKDFLTKLVARIKSAYEGMTPDSVEGGYVSEMLDAAEKLKALWTEALVEASDNYTSAEKTLFDNGIAVDSNTDSASLMSVRDLLNSEQQQKVAKTLAERFDVTVEEAKNWISAETSLASLILNPKYSQYLDYVADPNEEAIKSNSDYPQGTVDFSNICKKRRDFTEVMNRVLRNFPNHVFEATDLAKIRTIMSEEGMEVACGICYVEDRRQLDSIVAQNFIDSLALYRQGSKTRPDGSAFNANQLKALKLIDGDSYTPSIYELISLEGRNSLKAKNPAMEEAWVKYNNARGMQSVRLLLNDAEYKRQILDYKPSVVKRKNDLGGLRIYSFSDMEMFHLIDVIQVITDSAAVGLSLQGYTKVNEYAKAVKDTGEKLNRSLIPKGDLGYHIEDGKVVLDYDTVEGIDINHPDFFDNIDNPNVGNIVIGINATQIRAAMVSKFIDQIIPFHTGQSNEVLGEKGIATWENYKDFQSERDLSTGKKSSHQINIYTEVIQAAEAEGKPITNKVDFVNKFLEVCKENNLEPRFSEFLNVDENGDYVYTEGYHKFLVDFKTFDQNTGEYLPQMPVKPIFENKYITQLLKDYVKTQAKKDADFTKAVPKVLDRITNEIVNSNEVKYSDRASYAPTFYSYMGKVVDGIKSEKVGANGVVPYLKGKGVKAEEIKWSGIEAFLEGKKSVTKAELQEFVAGSQLQIVEQLSESELWDIVQDGENYIVKDKDGNILETWEPTQDPEDPELKGWISLEGGDIASTIEEIREYTGDWYGNDSTRWSQYRLDGGSNYRELVFQLPNSTYSNRAMRAHWGQDAEGVLAHARVQDFNVNGKKMLFIEELQSDWHNEGHQKGYSTEEYEDAVAVYDKLAEDYANKKRAFNKYVRSGEFRSDPDEVSKKKFDWLRRKMDEAEKKMQAAERDIEALKKKGMGDVPDAPFRSNYHEYVLKRLLRMAAEEGYDSIGWTPAEIQTKRWSEEFAEGYRIEYDQDMPSFLKKYGKKWGATVGKTEITGIEAWSMDIPNSMKDSVLHEGQVLYSDRYRAADTNSDILSMVEKVGNGNFKANEKVDLGTVSDFTATEIHKITGVNVKGFKVAIEARQIEHILKGHGKNGMTDRSMANPSDIAKIEYTLNDYDDIRPAGKTQAYTHMVNGKNRTADTVLYEKAIGEKSYYVVQAVPDTKAKTLYIVTAFIGKKGYKKEASQLINAKSLDVTAKTGSVTTSGSIISQSDDFVKREFSDVETKYSERDTDSVSNRTLLANALESVAQNDVERNKLKQYKSRIALIESEQAKLAEVKAKIKELSFAKGAKDTEAIKSLQFEANQTANRINTYDKQLLNLESTKALKDVIQRERQMAYKRAEQRGKEALSAYREKATKTQRELMTRYQESRKKNIEGRKQTAMRHKIKDVVSELNQYLLKGTKDKHVPIELQKAVAEALDAVNMDTVGAEERLAKLHDQLQKDPFNHQLLESYRRISEQGERMDGKLQALKNAYDEIVNSDDPLIANSHDEVISNSIAKVINEVGGTPLRDMTLTQLESVYDMYKMVLATIRNTNKAFKAAKGEEISTIANGVIAELMDMKRKSPYSTKITQSMSEFDWNNLKPVYAFERIGSANFTKVFEAVRAGEDAWAKDMSEAQAFREEQFKRYNYNTWDFKKRYGFTSTSGIHFELSLDQILSLYAFSKRKQAGDHLKYGGFVFDGLTEVKTKNKVGVTVTYQLKDATAYNLSEETLAEIIGALTPEQRAFADSMQDYLSTVMGEKGNEVSLALYDVKLFKEKYYFPLKSAPQYMAKAKEQAQGEVKIKNSGFTKETTPNAKNPIVLSSFMDVWAGHVNEMSMYHAFALPLEDFYRVYNYHTSADEKMEMVSVGASLENAHGQAAVKYIDQLLKDLNGGARVDSTVGIINKLTGLFKKSAVFASASVVVQQPSAIARATALVDTKYFVGKPSGKHRETWAEVKKYAPVAIIKEMGYFDTGMGKTSVEWLKGEKTLKDKIDDVASFAPALADELAWCAIWDAVKRETLYTHKDLKPNSEEFLKAVGERFTEVITKTQVYDSVLSRSANMRSKDTGMKMATAFMGEPTTSINMLQDALIQGKRGNKRYARKAIGGVVSSMILNSILVSIVYAGRDDDEDKTYIEKYIGTLTEELLDSFNPLTLIPFVKDIVSIVQGYDVERSDMAVITDLINAWNNLDNDNRSAYRKVEDFAGAIASIFGLPVKNIMRDARGMYNTVNSFINGEKTTEAGVKDSILEAVTGNEKSNGQQLYEAILSGDSAQIERVKSRFKDQKAINSAIRTALRENDSRIKQAAKARYNGDIAEYMRIAKKIIAEGNFSQDDIVSAINSEINALKKDEGTSDSSTSSNKVTSIYKMSDYYSALVGRDQATAYAVKEDLIKTDVANGKDREEAESNFNSNFASHLRELYEKGEINAYNAENMLVNYGGKSYEDASSKVRYWEFKKRYPDYDLSEEAVTKYYNEVEPYGIDVGVYYDYSKQRAKCKGVDSDGDGKTDSGSVKSEVMQVINSLPITYAQKDVLYYLNGWSASTIGEAPWH